MEDDRAESVFSRLEEAGNEFGDIATELSEKIYEIESRLAQMNGQTAAEIEDSGFELSYDRNDYGSWEIFFRDDNCPFTEDRSRVWLSLNKASIERKARAVVLLPKLFAEIEKVQKAKIELAGNALKRINALLESDGFVGKED